MKTQQELEVLSKHNFEEIAKQASELAQCVFIRKNTSDRKQKQVDFDRLLFQYQQYRNELKEYEK